MLVSFGPEPRSRSVDERYSLYCFVVIVVIIDQILADTLRYAVYVNSSDARVKRNQSAKSRCACEVGEQVLIYGGGIWSVCVCSAEMSTK